jgi:hypothetical protein
MATLATNVVTLADWAKNQDPNGKQARIAEVLRQKNAIIDDALWMMGNLPTGNRTTIRTGLPAVTWKLLNGATSPTKSREAQVDEACGIAETWSEIPVDIADLGGQPDVFRSSRAVAHMEAMSQEVAQTIFYGNSTTAPEEFTGLAARYSSQSAEIGQNILDAGGTGSDNASIWLIVWGENQVHGIYPQGSVMGLEHKNFGEETKETTDGLQRVYRENFKWKCGISVPDWRYAVRIANIDVSNLVTKSNAADLYDLMQMAIEHIPDDEAVSASGRFYMNRTVRQMLRIQARDDVGTGGGLTYDNVGGKRVLSMDGVPVRICDVLTVTEATVS